MRALQLFALTALIAASPLTPHGAAQSRFTTLYSFPATGNHGGQMPNGVTGANDVLYGTTYYGGADDNGSVFQLQPPAAPGGRWQESLLYSFTGANGDGSLPTAAPAVGPQGELYGTTYYGGVCIPFPGCPYYNGTVFALQSPSAPGGTWTEKVLYAFTGENGDGSNPIGNLVLGAHGALYGTTLSGGAFNNGTVFELRPPSTAGGTWMETVLYSFTGQNGDGANPNSITIGDKGVLYGTTLDFFLNGQAGTVWKLAPPSAPGRTWTEAVLHVFKGGEDGCYPEGAPVVGSDGSIYGTTYGTIIIIEYPGIYGNGTVFKLTPPSGGQWTKTVLYDFGASSPWGPDSPLLIHDGALYGAAGDMLSGQGGEFFRLQPPGPGVPPGVPWNLIPLHEFPSGNGNVPGGMFVMDRTGAFYGTTVGLDAVGADAGAIYRLAP
jgi:uncharacterized repeat protein (TIGR03803 family)